MGSNARGAEQFRGKSQHWQLPREHIPKAVYDNSRGRTDEVYFPTREAIPVILIPYLVGELLRKELGDI